MAGYHVSLRIAGPKPTRDALAYLAPMRATAAYRVGHLLVNIEVEAADVVDALARAKELVLGQLDGDVDLAQVTAVDGHWLRPGRLFGRKRN